MPFSPSPYPNLFFLVKEKRKKRERERERKYIVYLKWKQSFILMIDEKAFADFILTCVLIFSFGGFYSYKMYMMRKLHKNQIPRLTLGFHFLEKKMVTHCFRQKFTILIFCLFLIVLHNQCNLDFEYSKSNSVAFQCQNH